MLTRRTLTDWWRSAWSAVPDLTILVNNAGIYGPKGSIDQVDWRQWARAVEVNLLGSVLPARGR